MGGSNKQGIRWGEDKDDGADAQGHQEDGSKIVECGLFWLVSGA
jgi:hypothetical protein